MAEVRGKTSRFGPSALLLPERIAVVAAILIGSYHRLTFGWFAPFWLDEAYTGTIASQDHLSGLLRWCRHELSGPFFYSLMWIWEKLAGDSDFFLRFPSLILSFAAIALVVAAPGLTRRERLLWAALAAVWVPGLSYAALARPQALLFFLATGQVIAFLRCIDRPIAGRLAVWSAITSLMVLTHLHSTVIGGLQLVFILSQHRRKLSRLWPGLIPFALVALWVPLQLAFVSSFLQPGVASYPLLGPGHIFFMPFDLFGVSLAAYLACAFVVAILLLQLARHWARGQPLPYSRGEIMVGLSALLSILIVTAIGFIRPTYYVRYLIPFMPATLFAVTIVLARAKLFLDLVPSVVMLGWGWNVLSSALAYDSREAQQTLNEYEFQRGSDWLMAQGARRVLFIWASPSAGFNDWSLQAEMAGFFFRRAGYRADVQYAHLRPEQQTGEYLSRIARRQNASILWIDDAKRPQAIGAVPGMKCARFGGRRGRSMACALV